MNTSKSSNFYVWERDVVFPFISISSPHGMELSTEDTAQVIVNRIFTDHPKGPPKIVIVEKSIIDQQDIFFNDLSWEIYVSPEHLRLVVLLHECAHGLTIDQDEKVFIDTYIDLLDIYLNIKKEALEITLSEYGLVPMPLGKAPLVLEEK